MKGCRELLPWALGRIGHTGLSIVFYRRWLVVKKEVEGKGNLVADYMQGRVRVRIFDSAYSGKTQEDIDAILKRIANIAIQGAIQKASKSNHGG
jgi:hypothetical protein